MYLTDTSSVLSFYDQGFAKLPDAKVVEFTVVPGVPLAPLLPNLPDVPGGVFSSVAAGEEMPMSPTPLDLVSRLLVYPPENRLKASLALSHPWFTGPAGVLLPEDYQNATTSAARVLTASEGRPLGEWVEVLLGRMRK